MYYNRIFWETQKWSSVFMLNTNAVFHCRSDLLKWEGNVVIVLSNTALQLCSFLYWVVFSYLGSLIAKRWGLIQKRATGFNAFISKSV